MRGVAGDHAQIDLHTGNVGVQDFAHPYAATTTFSDTLSVYIPRDRVHAADALHRHSPSTALARSTLRGRTLAASAIHLYQRARTARRDDGERLAGSFVDTLNRVLRDGDLVPSDEDVRARLDAHIRRHLGDPQLGVGALCSIASYSRASIYRLYRADGGVDQYIRALRLRRCLSELSVASRERGVVADVATRWGFTNPSHFTRLFHGQFGVPPSEVLRGSASPRELAASTPAVRGIMTTRRWQHLD
jgi:AraC-like DNA-binding protein